MCGAIGRHEYKGSKVYRTYQVCILFSFVFMSVCRIPIIINELIVAEMYNKPNGKKENNKKRHGNWILIRCCRYI